MSEASPVVKVTRRVGAPPERAFAAWVDPALLVRWFCGPKAERSEAWTCAHPGGCYLIVMHGEQDWPHSGHYEIVEPPRHLAFSWYTPSTDNQRTDVDVRFTADGDGTRIELRHTGLAVDRAGDFDTGWRELLDRLDGCLDA